MDWLKIPVLVTTLADGDGPTSCQKQTDICKYPQVSSKIPSGVPGTAVGRFVALFTVIISLLLLFLILGNLCPQTKTNVKLGF